jgi:hypothetical protein
MPESSQESKVRLARRVRFRDVAGQGVLVQLEEGRVLVVNEVGLFVVQALGRQAMTETELAEAVAQAFEVDAARAKSDVAVFLEQLRGEKALQTVGGSGGDPTGE